MEEELSAISRAATNASREVSDSQSSSSQPHNKRTRQDVVSSSKFKGVVGQPNGHWGAQIYANHQRVWLGTFKSEREAAMAYDSAAIRLRSGDPHRNFSWTSITSEEPNFQSQFTTEAVLTMIKDGSYSSKFAEYVRMQHQDSQTLSSLHGREVLVCRQLFQKELTPSDVGKLNRLVIPKKFALKYFPVISDGVQPRDGRGGDVELLFFDRSMRSWKFRYCYWKSSQSFVFTRGWNKFVKEKNLRAKDTVIFSTSECKSGIEEVQTLCLIDVAHHGTEECRRSNNVTDQDGESLHLGLDPTVVDRCKGERVIEEMHCPSEMLRDVDRVAQLGSNVSSGKGCCATKGFRLFGVQIS